MRAAAYDLGREWPQLRPLDEEVVAFAERAAVGLGPAPTMVPQEVVEEGLAVIPRAEARRLAYAYARLDRHGWSDLCGAAGSERLAERMVAASALRAEIEERMIPSRPFLESIDAVRGGVFEDGVNTLMLFFAPTRVWSVGDAWDAIVDLGDAKLMSREWIDAVNALGDERVTDFHVARVRTLARQLERRLPFDGFPRLSSAISEGCRAIAHDDALAREFAVKLLGKDVLHQNRDFEVTVTRVG